MSPEEIEARARFRGRNNERAAAPLHLAALLSRVRPEVTAWVAAVDALQLSDIGRKLHFLAVARHSYGLTAGQERRQYELEREAAQIAGWYGLTARCGGDPRGYVLRLEGPGLPSSFGDGFGVG